MIKKYFNEKILIKDINIKKVVLSNINLDEYLYTKNSFFKILKTI